jgi:hypothetical protein
MFNFLLNGLAKLKLVKPCWETWEKIKYTTKADGERLPECPYGVGYRVGSYACVNYCIYYVGADKMAGTLYCNFKNQEKRR